MTPFRDVCELLVRSLSSGGQLALARVTLIDRELRWSASTGWTTHSRSADRDAMPLCVLTLYQPATWQSLSRIVDVTSRRHIDVFLPTETIVRDGLCRTLVTSRIAEVILAPHSAD